MGAESALPSALRLAYVRSLCTAVRRALASALRVHLRRVARARGYPDAQTGAVTCVQRYGGALNLNVHSHLLGLDGWPHRGGDGQLAFEEAAAPTQREVEQLLMDVHARVMRLLDRHGLLEPDTQDALVQEASALAACYEGAVLQRVGLGPLRGRPVMKLGQSLLC